MKSGLQKLDEVTAERGRPHRRPLLLLTCLLVSSSSWLTAAEIDLSKLPPATSNKIDFARDIKPILDASCIRCHGPEKPKSGFRLDHPAAALKGGDNGVDIIPGDSAKSPLIRYVARLVPDREMPPEGKGDPLTTNQIALLRAWIDQGAAWDNAIPTNLLDVSVSPLAGWTFISGDKQKFREHFWRRDGFAGGLDEFEIFQQNDPDTREIFSGHALQDDYKLTLAVERNDLGFVHTGWQQYRKYYDGTGGTGNFAPVPQTIGGDLHLDIGKAWVDFGLTLPHWPRMVLGYEYDYTHGTEAITAWGSNGGINPLNIAPNTKHLDEGTHIIKFDLDAEVKGVSIEDQFRGEFYHLNTAYTNQAARNAVKQNVGDHNTYFQGANSIRLERKFKDWLFASGGYFYSKLMASDSFTNAIFNNASVLFPATVPNITLTRETHFANLNGLLGPFNGLTLSLGAQSEWTRQQGFGSGDLNRIPFTLSPGSNLGIVSSILSSDYEQNTVSETVGLRYNKIPFTSLFTDLRLQQETISQSDQDIQATPDTSFIENPSFSSHSYDLRTGFNTSPWQPVSFTAYYRRYENESHYDTNQVPQPLGGYPGLISSRDLLTDEVNAKLTWRSCSWLKTTLSYQFINTDYRMDTRPAFIPVPFIPLSPGGSILAGKTDAHVYSLGATFTPLRRLLLSGTFSYQDSKTTTESLGIVPPYQGNTYSALASGTYLFDNATDLLLTYSFSLADYTQSNFGTDPNTPPPLGIRYQLHAVQAALTRRFTKNLSARLQYGFYYYDEPTAALVNNYTAQTIFASLTYHFR